MKSSAPKSPRLPGCGGDLDTVSGFWIGCMRVADTLDLEELASYVGGWPALARANVATLVEAGVPELQARLWLAQPVYHTRFRALTRCCSDYPPALAAMPHPPPLVFVDGDLACFHHGAVAIVGTRRCTPLGASTARRLAGACANAGMVVVSGLARGIDRHAHQGALYGGGRTVAVVAHGLAHTAPPSNIQLRSDILRSGGALLTTWPDETPPARWTFPVRNRWIAGLSRRVVIVEAPERSGALITATHLAELGRDDDLRVVPGPFAAETWRGSAGLLQMGAKPLCDVESLLQDLEVAPGLRNHANWLSALFAGASVDEAAALKGVTTAELVREIGLMEIRGRLVRLPGGRYTPSGGVP